MHLLNDIILQGSSQSQLQLVRLARLSARAENLVGETQVGALVRVHGHAKSISVGLEQGHALDITIELSRISHTIRASRQLILGILKVKHTLRNGLIVGSFIALLGFTKEV
jgi:hypothetical protein